MKTKYYDPKLSRAGIMDLIVTLEAQIKDEFVNEPKLIARMPHAQSDALDQLRLKVPSDLEPVATAWGFQYFDVYDKEKCVPYGCGSYGDPWHHQ